MNKKTTKKPSAAKSSCCSVEKKPQNPIVKFKKISHLAKAPEKAHQGDAGFDLFATEFNHPSGEDTGKYIEARTGISLEIPEGHVGLIFPRSSISKTKHYLRNSVGVIDSGYRGEIKLRFSFDDSSSSYGIGDKIAQIAFLKLPNVTLEESSDLSDSDRASGGFGSTGL